jgi:hypothetical protein
MFLVPTPASACQAISEDICSFVVLLICVDLSLGVPGGQFRLLSVSRIFLGEFGHILNKGETKETSNSTKHNGRRAVMPYQGKFVHLFGDLLEVSHVLNR